MLSRVLTGLLYYGLLLPISYLPFPLLYGLSDGLSAVLYHVVRYRRKVVEKQLADAFPEKTDAERRHIARTFYRHLADMILESVKTFTLPEHEVLARARCLNPELANAYAAAGRQVLAVAGHHQNFEWLALAAARLVNHRPVAVYKPLHNKFFDEKIRQSRSRLGLRLVPMQEVKNFLRNTSELYAVILAFDQAPANPRRGYWMRFLNQDTPVLYGAERNAREFDLPVVFAHTYREGRGRYAFSLEVVTEHPSQTETGFITEKITRLLEADIRRDPAYWLWSHRRWKHPRPEVMMLHE